MLTILLHSSKTMRPTPANEAHYQAPALLHEATHLAEYLQRLSTGQLQTIMQLSPAKTEQTAQLIQSWTDDPAKQQPAIDAFLGDIYSGLQVHTLTDDDRRYANDHLFILSGLYGILRALDSIHPYRLEMGYKLPDEPYRNLYRFWGDWLARQLPANAPIINLSAVEYTKAVLPYLPGARIITPKFLSVSPKTGQPVFVTVHAKIARGAFARWLITNRIEEDTSLASFDELGYVYDATASTATQPVFVATTFKGLGLSVRLT